MRLLDLRLEERTEFQDVVATVVWEKRRHPPQELRVGIDGAYADMFEMAPETFAIAALFPAMWHFERRLTMDAPICPILRENLNQAMQVITRWHPDVRPIDIEIEALPEPLQPRSGAGAALMLSGGVDSLASLRLNRLETTPNDPGWFRYGLVISSGFDEFDISPKGEFWSDLASIANITELDLVPLRTNIRELESGNYFFLQYLQGALLAHPVHNLARAVSQVAIASSADAVDPYPFGTHPDLDPLFGSGSLQVIHHEARPNRYEKIRFVGQWDEGLPYLRACFKTERNSAGGWNCGRCEKCVGTMLTLQMDGRLEAATSFVPDHISVSDLSPDLKLTHASHRNYRRLAEGLDEHGYADLAAYLRERMAAAEQRTYSTMRSRLKRFDLAYLGGFFTRTRRRIAG